MPSVSSNFNSSFGKRGVAQILVEDRRQVHAGLLIEVRDHVFRHDVPILEVLVEIVDQGPPACVVIHDAAQRVQKERAFEVLILRWFAVDAAGVMIGCWLRTFDL